MRTHRMIALTVLAASAGTALAQHGQRGYTGDPGLDPRVAAHMQPPVQVKWECEVRRGGGPTDTVTLWPNGVVPCEFDASLTNNGLTRQAMDIWMFRQGASPDVTFVRRDPNNPAHANYLLIKGVSGNVSSSNVGVQGGGQEVEQGAQVNNYVMAHEFCHALGFWHEHTRPDRDGYIDVWYSRVFPPQYQYNFDIVPGSQWAPGTRSLPYDFDSVMHYAATSFMDPSCDGGFATCISTLTCTPLVANILNISYQCTMGQQDHLSTSDVQEMINVYGTRPWALHFIGLAFPPPFPQVGTSTFPYQSLMQGADGDVWIVGNLSYNVPAGTTFSAPAVWNKHGAGPALIYGQ